MKRVLLTAMLGLGTAAFLAGCADMGATDPVLGNGGGNAYRPQLVSNQNVPNQVTVPDKKDEAETTAARENSIRVNRELAMLKADIEGLLEEQKRMMARIIGLEQDNLRKDEQIKELQSLLADMDKRFAEEDKNWQSRMETLRSTIDNERVERNKQLENFTRVITTEIDKNNAANQKQETEYKVLEVQSGDTLSSIAKTLGITVAELKKINNLTSDRIYIGQKIKFPVK